MSEYVRLSHPCREERAWQVWNTDYSCFNGRRIDHYHSPWVAWDSRNGNNRSFPTYTEAIAYIEQEEQPHE